MSVQYRKQWKVPSDSDPFKEYTVSLTMDGQYQCSCKHWIFRCHKAGTDCKHITDVKNGVHEPAPAYTLVLAQCQQVELQDDRATVHIPLRPVEDIDFLATILYDCIHLGVSWKAICELEHVPRGWSKEAVIAHVHAHGRKIYGDWVEGQGYQGFQKISMIGVIE